MTVVWVTDRARRAYNENRSAAMYSIQLKPQTSVSIEQAARFDTLVNRLREL